MKFLTCLVMTAVLALPSMLMAQANLWTAHEATEVPTMIDGSVMQPTLNPTEGGTVTIAPGLCFADLLGTGAIGGCAFGVLADPATGVVNDSTIDCDLNFIGINLEDIITPGAGANVNTIDTFTDNGDGTITMNLRIETEGMFPIDSDMFATDGPLIWIGYFMGENTGAPAGLQTDSDLFVTAATFDTFDINGDSESGGMPFEFDADALGIFFDAPGPWLGSIGIVFTGPDDDLDGVPDATATNTAFAYELTVTYEGTLPSCAGDKKMCIVGDLNGDTMVTLLDVQLFVDAVLSQTFSCEADVNEDMAVDLLDVQPFVTLLLGG